MLAITLHNVLNQSLPPYEVIVVDDGSEDNIGEVIQRYRSQVIFTKNKGKGPGAARNEGLRTATGNAIQFFDSDDLMTQNKLQVQSSLLQQQGIDFVYGPYVKAKDNSGNWERAGAIMQYFPLPARKLPNLVLEGWCLLTQSALFRRELLNEAGNWRTDLMPHEDREYWFRIATMAKAYKHENQSCVIYRQHGNQITDNAVVERERWLDGINATTVIKDEKKNGHALHSLLIFHGQRGYAKSFYNRKFKPDNPLSITLFELASSLYYQLTTKADVRLTGTGWKRMHGAIHSDKIFEDYIKQLS